MVCRNALASEVDKVHPAIIDLPVRGRGSVSESNALSTLGARWICKPSIMTSGGNPRSRALAAKVDMSRESKNFSASHRTAMTHSPRMDPDSMCAALLTVSSRGLFPARAESLW